jgi:hypothetical protein
MEYWIVVKTRLNNRLFTITPLLHHYAKKLLSTDFLADAIE